MIFRFDIHNPLQNNIPAGQKMEHQMNILQLNEKTRQNLNQLNDEFPVLEYDCKFLKVLLTAVFDKNVMKTADYDSLHNEKLKIIKNIFEQRTAGDTEYADARQIRFKSLVNRHCNNARMRN